MSQQRSAQTEIADAINAPNSTISDSQVNRVGELAQRRIDTRDTLPGFDNTKTETMARLAAGRSGGAKDGETFTIHK